MHFQYEPDLRAHLTRDDEDRVRQVLHTQQYFPSEQRNAHTTASTYPLGIAPTLGIPQLQFKRQAHANHADVPGTA